MTPVDPMATTRDEERLRAALRGRAALVEPADRFEDVLEATRGGRARRWAPLAAAAAVGIVVGGVWLAHPTSPEQQPTPALPLPSVSTAGPTAPSPSVGPTTSPTSSTAPSTVSPRPAAASPLPVYVIAPEVADVPDGRFGLRRSWVPTTVTNPNERVRVAVDAALDAAVPLADTPPWESVDVSSVRVTSSGITVELSGRPQAIGGAVDDLALAQVGWTAQAVLGRGNLPVTVRAGGDDLRVVTRPPTDQSWTVLTDVWVTGPLSGATVRSGPVVVRGEASVFEAALSWTLERRGATVRSGHLTASAGAPARGTYAIALGDLAPGTYTVRVVALSPKDGAPTASDVVTFSVR